MKALSFILAVPLLAATIAGVSTSTAHAATACTVSAVTTVTPTAAANGAKFTVDGNNVSVQYKVTGDATCTQSVTLATWQTPSALGTPYASQKLYKSVTATKTPGTYTISTTKPDCFYQLDLIVGTNATDPNGQPLYGKNGLKLLGAQVGGDKSCDVTPTPTPTPTPVAPTTPSAPAAPTALPNTGPGDVIGIAAAVSVVAGIAYSIRQRLSLNA